MSHILQVSFILTFSGPATFLIPFYCLRCQIRNLFLSNGKAISKFSRSLETEEFSEKIKENFPMCLKMFVFSTKMHHGVLFKGNVNVGILH